MTSVRRVIVSVLLALAALSAPAIGPAEEERADPAAERAPGAPSVRFGRPTILGSIPRELVLRHVQRRRAEIDGCYARLLARRPGLSGRIVLRFVIPSDGRVQGVSVERSTVGSRALERCVLAAAGRWTFGHGPPGMSVIHLPLVFDVGAAQREPEAAGS